MGSPPCILGTLADRGNRKTGKIVPQASNIKAAGHRETAGKSHRLAAGLHGKKNGTARSALSILTRWPGSSGASA
jgi:hypothetical protein